MPDPNYNRFRTLLCRFRRDERGNITIVTALTLLVMTSAVGMGMDYTLAGRREAQLNGIADAAALSTTTPQAMGLTSIQATANAVQLFNAQAALVQVVSFAPLTSANIIVTDTVGSNGAVTRATTVTYSAKSNNSYAALLHMPTIAIAGVSKVSSSLAPNIDFYVLLDTSPSMGIPATQSGIDTMVSKTQAQGGCAFACHETNPSSGDVAGNPGGIDNYTYARQLGLTLRIDLVKQATANLYATAQTTSTKNKASYRGATYTFDANFTTVTNLTSNMTQLQSDAANKVQMLQVYSENCLTANNCNNDEDTLFDTIMSYTQYIPNPGKGTNASGDTPQEVLFLVTDGVVDEPYPNVGNTTMTYFGNRTMTYAGYQSDYCTPLKNRGVRIAVLYTPYLPLPTNGFYNQYIGPFQPQVGPALQACASPGLFFQVNTGGDINGAMQALFAAAVGSAHLTQ